MPLEFEENVPQKTGYASAIPMPALETRTEAERQFATAWRGRQYKRCLELLSELPQSVSQETVETLVRIALAQPETGRGALPPVWMRESCLLALAKYRTPAILTQLSPLLFEDDVTIQNAAFKFFREAGDIGIPTLMVALKEQAAKRNRRSKGVSRGVSGIIGLLGDAKAKQATSVLGDILIHVVPTYRFLDKIERGLKLSALALWGTLTAVLWFWIIGGMLDGHPTMEMTAILFAMAISFICATFVAGLYFSAGFVLLLPLMIARDSRAQSLLRIKIIAAMRSIQDKRSLEYLMLRDEGGSDGVACNLAIQELLPLIEEGDEAWLGVAGRRWLSTHLRETTIANTLSLLRATRILGGEEMMRPVERLFAKAKAREVRHEAAQTLSALRAMRDAKQNKRELLRASGAPDDYKETLLRPLLDRRDPREERELLHPSDKPEE